MRAGGLPILTYHAFDTSGSVTATDPAWFAETLSALTRAGFQAVDLASWIARGRPVVERGYALTIDDGLQSIFEVADVVARHRATATVFLVTDRIGGDNAWQGQPADVPRGPLLSWSELESLEPLGFRFAAHGRTHVPLDRCDDRQLDDELRGARNAIEQRLGRPCPLFAYPYGRATPRIRQAARRHFAAAFGTRLDTANHEQDLHQVSRIDAYYLRSRRVLDRLVTGRLQGWLRMRRTLREGRGAMTYPFSWRLA
ncbi:Polysaccharide deacetylase [Singulisphaera sp. GP187]|uniref:polysaccharide deacetylase family protein n=1 Tax=Singulisphaera sp. GP187 TaxID=1882752 RepID=UPI000929983D|nr:polysaccharide deacetylase family protein [Singulisphaera sp. GP187]SIO15238.1 Polysaccharide deacetylase [Singulisphaera sp. GP187]